MCCFSATNRAAGEGAVKQWGGPARYVLLFAVFCLVCWLAGSFHLVTSSKGGARLVGKVSFSFSETLISLDAITGMPYLAAKMKYPLAVKALQRDGLLESEEDFQQRIREEVEREIWGTAGR